MRTMAVLFITAVLFSAAGLTSPPAQALASGFGFNSASTSKAPACTRQRVCEPHGCTWRTICH